MTERKETETRRELEFLSFSHDDDNDKEEENRVPFLSEYEIFNILSLCSADFLHNKGKLVCKSWATTLYSQFFIKKHLSLSNPTTLLFKFTPDFIYKHVRQCFGFEDKEIVWDSSSGLTLYDDIKIETLFLRNSITNQFSKIPYPPLPIDDSLSKLNVVYLPLTGQVKVIHNSRKPREQYTECFWSILTIGGAENMTWRMFDSTITDNRIVASDSIIQTFYSASVGCVVFYWTTTLVITNTTFLALDLHDESYHLVHVPSIYHKKGYWKFIPMVSELYLISIMRDLESSRRKYNRFRIWKMSDFRRSEWVEVLTVEMDAVLGLLLKKHFLDVIAWYEKEKELVFLTPNDGMMGHNFKLGKTNSIIHTCGKRPGCNNLYPHVYSLVRW